MNARRGTPYFPPPVLVAAGLLLIACATDPTPYQPLDEKKGGYEQTQLQERVYRVSFRGNRYTRETDVIDFLFLRCAELTRDNGFSHFQIQEDYGRTQVDLRPRGPSSSVGLGFGIASRRSFWGLGFSTGAHRYEGVVSYHLAMFVIHLLTPEEASSAAGAYEAEFLIRSLAPKKERSLKAES